MNLVRAQAAPDHLERAAHWHRREHLNGFGE
jgi:hypothetical protein